LATAYQGDVVFSQNPAAGKWVEVESIVSLMPGLAMPDLRGPLTEARRILLQAGMMGYLNNVRSIPTAGGTNGEVTIDWQSILPQTIVPRSSLVRVSGYQYVPYVPEFAQYPYSFPQYPPKRPITVIFDPGGSGGGSGCGPGPRPKVGEDDSPNPRYWGGAAAARVVGKVGAGGKAAGANDADLVDRYAQIRPTPPVKPPVCGPAGGMGGGIGLGGGGRKGGGSGMF
jgi:hypothetical protein